MHWQDKIIVAGLAIYVAVLGTVAWERSAGAQASGPTLPLLPLGYCQLAAIAAATPLSSCSGGIPAGANAMAFQVTTTSARYRDDGTAPTATVGMPVGTGATILYAGTLSKFSIIPTASTSTIDILFYKM